MNAVGATRDSSLEAAWAEGSLRGPALLESVAQSAGPAPVRPIGSYIRESRHLSDSQIEQILAHQGRTGTRFGVAAMALKLASSDDVQWALSRQFRYAYVSGGGTPLAPDLVVAIDPFGAQAEAFRDLRSQLVDGPMAADQPRAALAVVSAGAGDGKTYFASNMAIALSQLGGRTLLVDADLRTARLDRLFPARHSGIGLSAILAGRCGVDVTQPVAELPSLYVLPVGTLPPNPLELLEGPSFGLLMQEFCQRFDHVVVDTPAATRGADARVIATRCGLALVLFRRHASTVEPARALLASLARTRTRVAGVLLNEH